MTIFKRTIWILNQTIPGIYFVFWFISLPLIFLLFLSIKKARKDKAKPKKELYYYVFITSILPIFSAYIGARFYDTKSSGAYELSTFPFYITIIFTVIEILRQKKHRLMVVAIGGLILIFTISTLFVASMSIANDWI